MNIFFIFAINRINTAKQLPEEGFHKDLYTGVIDTAKVGVIASIQRIVDQVFMDALAYPGTEDEDDCPMIKSLLLPGLRSFCSALKGERSFVESYIMDLQIHRSVSIIFVGSVRDGRERG